MSCRSSHLAVHVTVLFSAMKVNDIGFCPLNCSCSLTAKRRPPSTSGPHVTNDVKSRDHLNMQQSRVTCRNRLIGDVDWLSDDRFPRNVTHV